MPIQKIKKIIITAIKEAWEETKPSWIEMNIAIEQSKEEFKKGLKK